MAAERPLCLPVVSNGIIPPFLLFFTRPVGLRRRCRWNFFVRGNGACGLTGQMSYTETGGERMELREVR